jgi:hypothetical protein
LTDSSQGCGKPAIVSTKSPAVSAHQVVWWSASSMPSWTWVLSGCGRRPKVTPRLRSQSLYALVGQSLAAWAAFGGG